jgi:hypothetical protein
MFIAASPGVVLMRLRYADLTHAVAAKRQRGGGNRSCTFCATRIARSFYFAKRLAAGIAFPSYCDAIYENYMSRKFLINTLIFPDFFVILD